MFDVGFSELLIIAVVALIVLGPERLPKAARFAGLWVRKARAQWYAVKSELEFELAQDEMKKHLQEVENSIKAPVLALQEDFAQAQTALENAVHLDAETLSLNAQEPGHIEDASVSAELNSHAPSASADLVDQADAAETASDTDDAIPDPKQGALW